MSTLAQNRARNAQVWVSRNRAVPAASSSSNLTRRAEPVDVIKAVRNRKAIKQTGAMRAMDGSNRQSAWAKSQNYKTAVTIDARWSK